VLTRFLRMGYAVVQTDYQGLGTPGVHPYYMGLAEGRSVVDLVRAARVLDRSIGPRWLPIGVSQGGHSTLWSAALGPTWTPELRLVGVVSLAPMTAMSLAFQFYRTFTTPNPATALSALSIAGAATMGWNPRSILTTRGAAAIQQVYSRCYYELKGPDSLGGIAPSDLTRSDADYAPFFRILDANDPVALKISVPIFMGQGTKDPALGAVSDLVRKLRRNGARVEYKLYPVTHGAPEVMAAYPDYSRFIAARFHQRS
jgi:pimeloyl-ACP methyl ester carboxylesterase